MHLRATWTPGPPVTVAVVGELDTATVAALLQTAATACRLGHHLEVLDLSGLTFVDAAGVRTIELLAGGCCGRTAAPVRPVGVSPRIARVFDLFGAAPVLAARRPE